MIKYLLLFLSAFVYEIGYVSFQIASVRGKIKRSMLLIPIVESLRWMIVALVSSANLGSKEQLTYIAIIITAFEIATFIKLKYLNRTGKDKDD